MADQITENKVPKRILNTLLSALSAGVVPRVGAPYIAIGRKEEIMSLLDNFEDVADVYVINTCSVTAVADKKSRQIISRVARKNENATIVVTGCFAQTKPEQAEKIPGVDIVIGNSEKVKICEIIEKFKGLSQRM